MKKMCILFPCDGTVVDVYVIFPKFLFTLQVFKATLEPSLGSQLLL